MLRRRRNDDGGVGGGHPVVVEPWWAAMRPLLMGDVELDALVPDDPVVSREEPWRSFAAAREAWRGGDSVRATEIWAGLARASGDSRVVLQAWSYLRGAAVPVPDPEAKRVLGVIVEVAMGESHDVLACYRDGGVRFYPGAGGGTVLVGIDDESVVSAAGSLFEAAEALVRSIGPWDQGPLPPLPVGHSRLSLLTPSGPHFGQGPTDEMFASPLGGPVAAAATTLLMAVVELDGRTEH